MDFAYYVAATQKNAGAGGRCWFRPPGNYCLRSRVPYPLGETIGFPVDDAGRPAPVRDARPGWWRVYACLNGRIIGACVDATNPDKLFDVGASWQIP